MARAITESWDHIIEQIIALVRERMPDQESVVEHFVRCYYRNTSVKDLQASRISDLYGAAIAHWNLAHQRKAGDEAKIHVYNPRFDEHGWQSSHTIVEVVADDTPFLVDSARMAINRCGLSIHLAIHPVMYVSRDAEGNLTKVADGNSPLAGADLESFMHFEIDRQTSGATLERVQQTIKEALQDVHTVVSDFGAMCERLDSILQELDADPPPLDAEELKEGRAFLQWLRDGHFIFLGYREHTLTHTDNEDRLHIVPNTALGILRKTETGENTDLICQSFAALSPEARRLAQKPELLVITRSGSESTVHRPGYMDYIGVKQIDKDGNVVGERRFLGLYTASSYISDTRTIPLLRRKVAKVIDRSGYHEHSHARRALVNILETFPRDELFQISDDELLNTALGILHLQERQRTTVFIRRDPYGRFFSCLVFIPRDHMSTGVRQRIGEILEQALEGECIKFSVQISESVLARVHYVILTPPGATTHYDADNIEARIVAATRPWRDHLHQALLEQCGEEEGTRLFRRFGEGFRADYRESYAPELAVHDARKLDRLKGPGDIAMALYKPLEGADNFLRFKLFNYGRPVPLSEALPMMENMGLKVIDEDPSRITLPGGARIWIHDFGMEHSEEDLDLDQVKEIFQDAFVRIFRGEVSNDGFNRLTLRARLSWREVVILRAYCKYLRQVRATFSQEYMERALAGNPAIARLLVDLFAARFDPERAEARVDAATDVETRIRAALDDVANLDEDRILRSFSETIGATLRTNYYQPAADGSNKDYVSFKLDSARVPDMPEPRPKYEIFVYSPRVEGVHLRGGSIARGGLRWSDRPEDFRTEVLGLVKAQMVKNAVIVPVGSKGGFVPKRPPVDGNREQILAEGVACYKNFISGLLDVTDNLVGGDVVPPPKVVRHDDDDPYLVVAADKGTATFSDIANEVAGSYGFWLGDAFASGGSAGYDHKGMGITARGAWESVKRHFRELGLDTQSEDFTVIGIGDMSGDVFGNGMLLSPRIKLIGAFNHQHIFLDPNPDCARSFAERQRLFQLPRSSWEDYDRDLISPGGGVYRRSAKSIPLSAEARAALQVDAPALTPNELIRAMLTAPADLLWNGGIGTYVKASSEQNADVGDRANDAVRINAEQLRCRVVGEGGNLGFTQLGRIEFARRNGRVHTDAIDNSGGVDCSDHEVNIKILLNAVVGAGDMTMKQRNDLLVRMTDEVARLVLKNNYLQTQALSLANAQSREMLDVHSRLLRDLEHTGKLDRTLEFLPGEELLLERKNAGEGLTSPEFAVVLAYVKIGLYDRLLTSDLPDEPYLERTLANYFPTPLRESFSQAMSQHRLRREIIATEIVNGMVNRAGISFAFRLREETGAAEADIARAYVIVREIFALPDLWAQIEALDNRVAADVQLAMLLDTRKLLERTTRWILRNRPRPLSVADDVERYGPALDRLAATMTNHVGEEERTSAQGKADELIQTGVPEELAMRVAMFTSLSSGLDLVEVASATDLDVERVADGYFEVGERLDLHWLRDRIADLPRDTHWQIMARAALRDDLFQLHKQITTSVLAGATADADMDMLVAAWAERNRLPMERCSQIIAELRSGPTPDFTMLSVAMRELRGLVQSASAAAAPEATNQSELVAAVSGMVHHEPATKDIGELRQ